MSPSDLIRSICDQNLAVYRASPIRLREDVGQEAEIAHDYRGRIVYSCSRTPTMRWQTTPAPRTRCSSALPTQTSGSATPGVHSTTMTCVACAGSAPAAKGVL